MATLMKKYQFYGDNWNGNGGHRDGVEDNWDGNGNKIDGDRDNRMGKGYNNDGDVME